MAKLLTTWIFEVIRPEESDTKDWVREASDEDVAELDKYLSAQEENVDGPSANDDERVRISV